ncbi:hypothetical protein [Natronoglycomyces albus]|uniref:HNH endonuclease n=1 Tax=Natronoglycomyces albus TaxID=2811108 RepID=A0A895XNE0_9ACTN|nr:hypothetical protein [Natronoglycomyces albus]QSB07161.1 hypothetical protein JQS30_17110 [Natronoglycomyces albus]
MTALDALGAPVPTPPGVDPKFWARFSRRVLIIPNGCHLWTGPPRDDGYGQLHVAKGAIAGADRTRIWRAHRAAYAALTAEVLTEEIHLLHSCDQPLCCPLTTEALRDHLAPGDNVTNVSERESRNRSTRIGSGGLAIPTRADRRGQANRSRALHQALTTALVSASPIGHDRDAIAARIAAVDHAGSWEAIQPPLTDLDNL